MEQLHGLTDQVKRAGDDDAGISAGLLQCFNEGATDDNWSLRIGLFTGGQQFSRSKRAFALD